MVDRILDLLFFRWLRLGRARRRFLDGLESEFAEEFLEALLNLMGLTVRFSAGFRRSVAGFSGRYQFRSADGDITVSAVFDRGRLTVREAGIEDPDVTVRFRDGRALINYLLAPKPDIIGSLLRQDVVIDGNFNYVYRFAYLANHLRLMGQGAV